MSSTHGFGPLPTLQLSRWHELVNAAAIGLLDERHWCELKQDLAPGPAGNRELAKDLASLAVDGGLLIVGIADQGGRAGEVLGITLAGVADRIAQVAAARLHPGLPVTTEEVTHPDDPTRGCIIVRVPASMIAPHMAEDIYWQRSDKSKMVMPDPQVRRLLSTQTDTEDTFRQRLDELAHTGGLGQNITFLAQAITRSTTTWTDQLDPADIPRSWAPLSPSTKDFGRFLSLDDLPQPQRTVRGLHAYTNQSDQWNARWLRLEMNDTPASLTLTGTSNPGKASIETPNTGGAHLQIQTIDLLGLTRLVLGMTRLTSHIAPHATPLASWRLGIHIGGLMGTVPADPTPTYPSHALQQYDSDYTHICTATPTDLTNPTELTIQLTRLLARSFQRTPDSLIPNDTAHQ